MCACACASLRYDSGTILLEGTDGQTIVTIFGQGLWTWDGRRLSSNETMSKTPLLAPTTAHPGARSGLDSKLGAWDNQHTMENQVTLSSFRKRFVRTPWALLCLFGASLRRMVGALWMNRKHRISPAFAEKLMLAVSGVNACVYCSYRHTKTALEQGVSEAEIQRLLSGSTDGFSEEEAIGITYAQHWAESDGRPSVGARQRVTATYGEETTRYMELYMHAVYLGNMCSNTVEAYRMGDAVKSGRVRFFLTYLLCAPIAFFIRRSGHRPGVAPPDL